MVKGRVIILNGVGSVGKSSTARALQAMSVLPFLQVSMDAFIQMMPIRLIGDPEGLVFQRREDDGLPCVEIQSGPVFKRILAGMRHAVGALVDQGNDVIVDEVMFGQEAEEYRTLLGRHDLRFVGLFAPLDVLESRERARGDRELGLSRWQYQRVHGGIEYDLTLDTEHSSPAENGVSVAPRTGKCCCAAGRPRAALPRRPPAG